MRINPITKVGLFRKVKEVVFMKLDTKAITPERGSEIIDFVTKYIFTLKDDAEIEQFSSYISKNFPEIQEVQLSYDVEEHESVDNIVKEIMNTFMNAGDMEKASHILGEMERAGDSATLLSDLERRYPEAYALSVAKVKK